MHVPFDTFNDSVYLARYMVYVFVIRSETGESGPLISLWTNSTVRPNGTNRYERSQALLDSLEVNHPDVFQRMKKIRRGKKIPVVLLGFIMCMCIVASVCSMGGTCSEAAKKFTDLAKGTLMLSELVDVTDCSTEISFPLHP